MSASNFAFGTAWELEIAKYFKDKFGGHFDISPGSRGPADITNHTPNAIILTQAKASREGSKAHPSVSTTEKQKLIAKCRGIAQSRKKKVIAMLALKKGATVRFRIIARFDPETASKCTDDCSGGNTAAK